MAINNTAVFGIYNTRISVENAVDALKAAGFSNTDISVLFPHDEGNKSVVGGEHNRAPEDAVTGVGTGVIIGGTLGWLVGIGALAIPGVGPFIAAGPIMASLVGAGVGGTVGGVTGALIGMGIPESEATRLERLITEGGIFLSVHCTLTDQTKKAKEILKKAGSDSVSSIDVTKADFDKANKTTVRL